MNARVYNPQTARFLSADRVVHDIGDSQTYNRYSYCANNPVNATDPTGNDYTVMIDGVANAMTDAAFGALLQLLQAKGVQVTFTGFSAGEIAKLLGVSSDGGASAATGLLSQGTGAFQTTQAGVGTGTTQSSTTAQQSVGPSDGIKSTSQGNLGYKYEADAAVAIAKQIAGMKRVDGREYGASIFRYSLDGGKTSYYGFTPITEGFFNKEGGAFWDPHTDYSGVPKGPPKQAMFIDPISGNEYSVESGKRGKIAGVKFTADLHLHPYGAAYAGFDYGDIDANIADRINGYLLDQTTARMFYAPLQKFAVPDHPDTYSIPREVKDRQIPMDAITPAELRKLGL